MNAPMDEQAELRRQRDAFRDQRNAVFATNTELLARVERADLERLQVENENRTLKRRVAELEMAIGTARAMHRKFVDSEHCQYDGMEWPCPNVIVLDGTVTDLAAAVDALGALPMPTGGVDFLAIEQDRPATRFTHDCTLPLTRRLDCGHCPHEVCQDCERCPHTCRCAPPEDRHDSPLHSSYATPRDLPEIPAQRDRGTGL